MARQDWEETWVPAFLLAVVLAVLAGIACLAYFKGREDAATCPACQRPCQP